MLHPRQKLADIVNEATNRSRVIAPYSSIIEHENAIRIALAAYQPTLMFYGHYNAGKSTLVNSLLSCDGQPVADTADRPCTDAIDAYDFGDYRVYDTPGIDAPIEHENVSREHLRSTHVIVFVTTTSGNIDEKSTIDELVEIWKTGRSLIVALNDKQGHQPDSEAVTHQVTTLYENLERAAGTSDITQAVDVLWVNAMRGWKAREFLTSKDPVKNEKGARLWDLSNIDALETLMMNALMETTGNELLRPAAVTLEQALSETIIHLESSASDEDERSFYKTLKSTITATKQLFLQKGEAALKRLTHELQQDLFAALEAGVPLEHMYESFSDKAGELIGAELQSAQQELFVHFSNINSGTNVRFDLNLDAFGGFSGDQDGAGGFQFDVKRSGEVLAKYLESDSGKKIIKGVLLKLRKWKIPGFKGRWERTLGKWAGKVGKGLGVTIQAATLAYEVRGAFKDHQEAMSAEQERREQLTRHTHRLAGDAERLVKRQLPMLAHDAFEELDNEVDEQLNNANEQDESIKSLIARLRELRLEVIKIQATL